VPPSPRQAHVVVHLQKPWDPVLLPVPLQKGQHPLDLSIGLLLFEEGLYPMQWTVRDQLSCDHKCKANDTLP
jgi:hypothetical protein